MHGTSQPAVYPVRNNSSCSFQFDLLPTPANESIWWFTSQEEKQPVGSEQEGDRQPCSDECALWYYNSGEGSSRARRVDPTKESSTLPPKESPKGGRNILELMAKVVYDEKPVCWRLGWDITINFFIVDFLLNILL